MTEPGNQGGRAAFVFEQLNLRILRVLVAGLLAGAITPASGSNATARESESVRFVLLVDTAVHMAGQRDVLAQAVADKITNAFDGQATPGDLFLLWPFSQSALTNAFMPVKWSPRNRDLYSKRLARAMTASPFTGAPRFDRVLEDISPLFKSKEALTVFILSDGTVPIAGTGFDHEINASYAEAASLPAPSNSLLQTRLTVSKGAVTNWVVERVRHQLRQVIHSSQERQNSTTAAETPRAIPGSIPAPALEATLDLTSAQLTAALPPVVDRTPAAPSEVEVENQLAIDVQLEAFSGLEAIGFADPIGDEPATVPSDTVTIGPSAPSPSTNSSTASAPPRDREANPVSVVDELPVTSAVEHFDKWEAKLGPTPREPSPEQFPSGLRSPPAPPTAAVRTSIAETEIAPIAPRTASIPLTHSTLQRPVHKRAWPYLAGATGLLLLCVSWRKGRRGSRAVEVSSLVSRYYPERPPSSPDCIAPRA